MGRRKEAKTMEVTEVTMEVMKKPPRANMDRAAEAAVEAMEILAKIEDATRNVDNAAMRVAKVKGELKFVREVYDDHVEHLKDLCRTRMERLPLLDGEPERDGGSDEDGGEDDGGESVTDAGKTTDKNGWKKLPLEELGLHTTTAKALIEDGFTTIGMLVDEMTSDPLSWHEDIKGVGPATVSAIAEKFAEFWREHPEWDEEEGDGEDDGEGDDGEGEDREIDAEYEVVDDEVEDESEEDDEESDEDESNDDNE